MRSLLLPPQTIAAETAEIIASRRMIDLPFLKPMNWSGRNFYQKPSSIAKSSGFAKHRNLWRSGVVACAATNAPRAISGQSTQGTSQQPINAAPIGAAGQIYRIFCVSRSMPRRGAPHIDFTTEQANYQCQPINAASGGAAFWSS